ncbi:hypothetical protein KIH31_15310 [Paenarthrobacter sp. DKR-5]|uniref:hypothetical protein n=1 Tax=Paenarthrobacter sp. DKR-5 TaxID=2835535 RepID=UPI001BDC7655|nr:hypothetical protein [Paenarthrobacter sp. DKR-5]MBT1003958.1 hypothetical protein [Paenarthrobacter sp. DKR-5]
MELDPASRPGWLPGWDALITGGGWAVLLASLIITPGMPLLLAALTEHRMLRPSRDFLSLVLGDLALAVAAGTATAVIDQEQLSPPLWLSGPTGWLIPAAGLVFGLHQVRTELKTLFYIREQAWAPTKIYHQFVIYPVHGYLLTSTVPTALASAGPPASKLVITAAVSLWGAALIYDTRHPKLGHAPFDWSRFKPLPQPWPATSTTLRVDVAWQKNHPRHSRSRNRPATPA